MKTLKFFPFYLLSLLPFPVLYLLSDFTFVLIYYVAGYRRAVVKANLVTSFPDKTPAEISDIERKFFKHFCDLIFESIKVLTISNKEISKRIRLKNKALIERLYRENRNVILYLGHHGNWEWLTFLPLFLSYQITTLYQPLANKYFDQLIQFTRSKYGILCIESSKGYKTLLQLKREKVLSMNYIVGDQSPGGHSSMYWTDFLHQETAFLVGADRIAKKSDQSVVFPAFRKLKRGHYEIRFILLEEFPKQVMDNEIAERFARTLEETIIQAPELWLWSHKRWKLDKHSLPS